MAKEITIDLEVLEVEAEKILADARTRASEILLEARQEAKRILSSQLTMDDVKTECQKLVTRSKAEADKKIQDSEKQAAEISTKADKRLEGIADRVVSIVRGKS